ncbi:MAG: LysR family transcriptional regulator [Deltaproteobacteria bacterium]|nr:LysR family transcriptional regulator [Deltaproteobacteria bacterium]
MEIDQLKAFQQIARTGSYSIASRNLFITQSAVSHQIRKLEKELDIKLFERLGNVSKLTKQGEVLSVGVDKLLDALDNLIKLSEDIRGSKYGHLSIATTNGIMSYVLEDVIDRFAKQFPKIRFKLISGAVATELVSLVSNDEVDLSIVPKVNQAEFRKLTFKHWRSFGLVLLTAKDHPLQKKKAINLRAISRLPLILYRKGAVLRRLVDDAFARSNLPYDVVMETDLEENLRNYVEKGIGVTITVSFAVTPEDKKRFWSVDVSHLFGKMDYGIYYRKNKYVTKAMLQFIKIFTSSFPSCR